MDKSPEIIFLLKSIITHLVTEVGKEPDKLFDERFKKFKLVELIPGSEPVYIQMEKISIISDT
jgi:hypothetical protein